MWPTRRLPFSAIATIEGVVLYPPRFGITEGVPSSTIATHEFVVPRSIPITLSLAIATYCPLDFEGVARGWAGQNARRRALPPAHLRVLGAPSGCPQDDSSFRTSARSFRSSAVSTS